MESIKRKQAREDYYARAYNMTVAEKILPKQLEIETLLESGKSVLQIAKQLDLPKDTFRKFVNNEYMIYGELVIPQRSVGKGWIMQTDNAILFIDDKGEEYFLHRVVLTRDYGEFRKGSQMGWIEHEGNLQDEAMVFGEAKIYGRAEVKGKARVFDKAEVKDNATIDGTAMICDKCKIKDNVRITDTLITGNVEISGNTVVKGGFHLQSENIAVKRTITSGEITEPDNTKINYEIR